MQTEFIAPDLEILEETITNTGNSLAELSKKCSIMLIFLRHFGCVFCKTAMIDIAKKRNELENRGVKTVFVHMSDTATANKYFKQFNLKDVSFVNDPNKQLYRAFGLVRGTFTQLFGLQTWIKGYSVMKENNLKQESGKNLGDSFQMPGVFLINEGKIIESFIHKKASDRPDYFKLAECCMI